jgi:hypothetical protein
MPWLNLRDMADRDVKAIYAYLKHLGPAGQPAPHYVPADKTPGRPFCSSQQRPSRQARDEELAPATIAGCRSLARGRRKSSTGRSSGRGP